MFGQSGGRARQVWLNPLKTGFWRDVSGNTMIAFGLIAATLVAAAGAGVEFSQAQEQTNRLQDAADAAALRGALMAKDETAAKAAADTVFTLNLTDSGIAPTSKGLKFEISGSHKTAVYTATAQIKTTFLKLAGIETLTVGATSTAEAEMRKSEIALVLDSTGSMSRDSRMTNLKAAVDSVLASLLVSGENVWDARVGIVPFDTQVSIRGVPAAGIAGEFGETPYTYSCTGSSMTSDRCTSLGTTRDLMCSGAADVAACRANARIYAYTTSGGTYRVFVTSNYVQNNGYCWPNYYTYTYCGYTVVSRTDYYSTTTWTRTNNASNSTPWPSASYYGTPSYSYAQYNGTITATPTSAGGYGSGSTTTIKDNSTITANSDLLGVGTDSWNGCVIDRKQPYDVSGQSPIASNTDTLYPAAKCATNNLLPVMGLTTDIAAVRAHAQKLTPAGNTNITIGVQWGMELLSPELPFNTAKPYSDKTNYKYMIVITDGENTQNRWSTSASTINARTLLACQAAKDLGITVYTIRVMEGNSDMLKSCASRPEYFYDVTASSQLTSTLAKVFYSIQSTRLTK
ncbi:pilus assembly protein TadG-related protein [Asticcacaulis excentricus]|uniref:von Willebrand factor type A n=1 Tax=Asticcacaulis excentricus (strain ATCC 15261 / DSM 4724 / KCTC 12464 / NCIMB 9791 / VKM B-1370 / CB 48) TaxID=573065 RepID=E8RN21_ASTEC|nr:pilus assembly protein TadG-related protein [Asticcacaulis excentricus]ADU12854.1 von Willebrand factor type A [Asticcacaulis excentricus CB 48]